jgi:hypothetical protein
VSERYWDAPLGASIAQDVTEASSDGSVYTCFRCTYTATGNTKEMTLLALDAIKQYITETDWPPA